MKGGEKNIFKNLEFLYIFDKIGRDPLLKYFFDQKFLGVGKKN